MLEKGKWIHDNFLSNTNKPKKAFVRQESSFRHKITTNPEDRFIAQAGRYHLFVSYACPWAHRTLVMRTLKGLESVISVSEVQPLINNHGWELNKQQLSEHPEIPQVDYLHELYQHAEADYTGRVTVPVLWDKQTNTIINNESAEIIRLFNRAFDAITGNTYDAYPLASQPLIDSLNEKIYTNINNGVYACGFAHEQNAYEQAYDRLFATLTELEALLENQPYLCGDEHTEADWRLFTTLVRFDLVYFSHFKCNKKRLSDFHNLNAYLVRLAQITGIKKTIRAGDIKTHYYGSQKQLNPSGIIPKGPDVEFF